MSGCRLGGYIATGDLEDIFRASVFYVLRNSSKKTITESRNTQKSSAPHPTLQIFTWHLFEGHALKSTSGLEFQKDPSMHGRGVRGF